jgi:hypothetical protein
MPREPGPHGKPYNRRKKPKRIRCWCCGQPFEAIRCTAYLCSPACRQKWTRARRAGNPLTRHPDSYRIWD